MLPPIEISERRTSADVVFDTLHDSIVSLKLWPGTKLSEAEVAKRFGVSRQPVRDAFSRLANLDLLLVRPQKATEVRGFSMERVAHARFLRLSVELEVIRRACAVWDETCGRELEENLGRQEQAVEAGEPETFHALDATFHLQICELAACDMAVRTIEECKRTIDRLCKLSLGRGRETAILLEDHRDMARALERGSVGDATEAVRRHLSRLDDTIAQVQREHAQYFE